MRREIKPSNSEFRKILENKCETEKKTALKSNRMAIFRNKWQT